MKNEIEQKITDNTSTGKAKIDVSNPLTESALDTRISDLKSTIKSFNTLMWSIVIGVIIVLFLGFVSTLTAMQALVVESNNTKTSSYESINTKIDNLSQQLQNNGTTIKK